MDVGISGLPVLLKRGLIVLHRWLGVALSVLFLLWFGSGIVMMYWTFPSVSAPDRRQRAPALDPARIVVSPEAAFSVLGREGAPAYARLDTFDGRPVYCFDDDGRRRRRGRGDAAIVYADDGSEHQAVDQALVDRAAAAWSGRPLGEARRERVETVDQWTVGDLQGMRPLIRYTWPDGQQVYVHGETGEVVQYTTTASRFWAYLGAIPHWLYFTPLRRHGPQWFSFVVWSSLIGTVTAILGIVLIVWMYSPRRRYRHGGAPTGIPYRGWKRWHAIAGALFGVLTTTWAFSGLLSMGPFPIMNRVTDLIAPPEALDGGSAALFVDLDFALRDRHTVDLSSYERKTPADAIRSVPGFEVKELELTSFAGEAVYVATNAEGATRIVPVDGEPREAFDVNGVMRFVREAAGPALAELRLMHQYDAYYRDRHRSRPLPVIYARLNDAAGTRYYIDPGTARVVGDYSARDWVTRWLYHGLHSLDFPWLYNHRPLWDVVVLALMLGGTALSATSIVLTWRVLTRKAAAIVRAQIHPPDEDLALDVDA